MSTNIRHVPYVPRHATVMPMLYIGGVPCASRRFDTPFGELWIPVWGWGLN